MLDLGGSNFYTLKSNKKYSSVYSHVLDELVKLMNESVSSLGVAITQQIVTPFISESART